MDFLGDVILINEISVPNLSFALQNKIVQMSRLLYGHLGHVLSISNYVIDPSKTSMSAVVQE